MGTKMVRLRGEHILLSKAQRPLSAVVNRPDAFFLYAVSEKKEKKRGREKESKGKRGKREDKRGVMVRLRSTSFSAKPSDPYRQL
jgi:hypothetical protein